MKLDFYKYQGAGNDFVLVDNRDAHSDTFNTDTVARICNRHFGVGADGLMLLQAKSGYDFEMIYYNADGRPGSMCGNGGRCIVAFARDLKLIHNETNFLAVDGPHYAKISEDGERISLEMIEVAQVNRDGEAYVLNTGSPHYVLLTKNLQQKDVYHDGYAIRNNETYKQEGINVNFVEDFGDHYFVRTFERGVEDETYACGTGVTAVAMAMAIEKGLTGNISTPIRVLGGNLNIRFHFDGQRFSDVFLEGPAKFVFRGEVNL